MYLFGAYILFKKSLKFATFCVMEINYFLCTDVALLLFLKSKFGVRNLSCHVLCQKFLYQKNTK